MGESGILVSHLLLLLLRIHLGSLLWLLLWNLLDWLLGKMLLLILRINWRLLRLLVSLCLSRLTSRLRLINLLSLWCYVGLSLRHIWLRRLIRLINLWFRLSLLRLSSILLIDTTFLASFFLKITENSLRVILAILNWLLRLISLACWSAMWTNLTFGKEL